MQHTGKGDFNTGGEGSFLTEKHALDKNITESQRVFPMNRCIHSKGS